MPPALVDDSGKVTPATVDVNVDLIQVISIRQLSLIKFKNLSMPILKIKVNEIEDFKQYMDVTYVMQIGWTDHRITSVGLFTRFTRSRDECDVFIN